MINFQNIKFIKSCTSYKDRPKDDLKEMLLVGRSNVGKSSLINALSNNKNLAKVSKTQGKTKLLNYFNVDNKFYIVDAPGYGGAKVNLETDQLFLNMMSDYFENPSLKYVLFLLDSRRIPSEDDVMFYNFLKEEKINYSFVLTKCDKLNQKEKSQIIKNISQSFGKFDEKKLIYTSKNIQSSLDNLKKVLTTK